MFQSLRTNSPFYILTNNGIPHLDVGIVTAVSGPYIKFPAIPQGIGQQTEYVVDVAVQVNGQTQKFQKLPANKEIADFGEGFGNLIVSMSKDAINNEIATLKAKSVDHINRIEEEKQKILAYDTIYEQINPEYAEKQKQDAEIASLKNQVAAIVNTNTNLEQMISQLLAEIKGTSSKS